MRQVSSAVSMALASRDISNEVRRTVQRRRGSLSFLAGLSLVLTTWAACRPTRSATAQRLRRRA